MTAIAERDPATGWSAMPGWGVVADLTPPELGAARALRTLKLALAAALVLLVLLCAGGYLLAVRARSSAQDDLAAANARTTQLTVLQNRYGVVTRIKGTTSTIDGQLASLLAGDVDASGLLNRVRGALPDGAELTSVTIGMTGPSSTTPAATGTAAPPTGTITLNGSSRRMVDLAAFVSALGSLRGVSDVVPTTNSSGSTHGRADWSVTANLTSAALSHHYTVGGSK